MMKSSNFWIFELYLMNGVKIKKYISYFRPLNESFNKMVELVN